MPAERIAFGTCAPLNGGSQNRGQQGSEPPRTESSAEKRWHQRVENSVPSATTTTSHRVSEDTRLGQAARRRKAGGTDEFGLPDRGTRPLQGHDAQAGRVHQAIPDPRPA